MRIRSRFILQSLDNKKQKTLINLIPIGFQSQSTPSSSGRSNRISVSFASFRRHTMPNPERCALEQLDTFLFPRNNVGGNCIPYIHGAAEENPARDQVALQKPVRYVAEFLCLTWQRDCLEGVLPCHEPTLSFKINWQVFTTATHADNLVMYWHTHPIRSLPNKSAAVLKMWLDECDLPAVWTKSIRYVNYSYTPLWELTCKWIDMRARLKFCCPTSSCKGKTNWVTIEQRLIVCSLSKRPHWVHTAVFLHDGAFEVKEVQFFRIVDSPSSPPSSSYISGPVDTRPSCQCHRYWSDIRLLCEVEGDVSCYYVATGECIPVIYDAETDFEILYRRLKHRWEKKILSKLNILILEKVSLVNAKGHDITYLSVKWQQRRAPNSSNY